MLAEIAKTLLEFLKLTPGYFLVAAGVSGFLLYVDTQVLQKLGVTQFAENNRSIIGMVLIVSVALFSLSIWNFIVGGLGKKWRLRKFHLKIAEKLTRLTEAEKQILRFYYAKQTRTNVLRIDDGVVQGLVAICQRRSMWFFLRMEKRLGDKRFV